ncbi:hypothetical protein AB0764_27420 (plasmid) [Priestia megaterium]|uniref:hypothetical protein n=1 Tax=Priestia megaterium TaxID=1404 RepID=UPI00351F0D3D
MFGIGLVAYIFHEMEERLKEVPTTKAESKKDQYGLGELNVSSSKESENTI